MRLPRLDRLDASGTDRSNLEHRAPAHPRQRAGFDEFFRRVEGARKRRKLPVVVGMEGTGGWAQPLDGMVREHGYELLNVNNMKLARFKEIFPGVPSVGVGASFFSVGVGASFFDFSTNRRE